MPIYLRPILAAIFLPLRSSIIRRSACNSIASAIASASPGSTFCCSACTKAWFLTCRVSIHPNVWTSLAPGTAGPAPVNSRVTAWGITMCRYSCCRSSSYLTAARLVMGEVLLTIFTGSLILRESAGLLENPLHHNADKYCDWQGVVEN